MSLKCKIEVSEDPEKGWKAVINDDSPECLEALKKLSEQLNVFTRGAVKRRIETSNPKVKSALKKLGLNPGKHEESQYEIEGWVQLAVWTKIEAKNREEAIKKLRSQEWEEIHEGPWESDITIDKITKIRNGSKQVLEVE